MKTTTTSQHQPSGDGPSGRPSVATYLAAFPFLLAEHQAQNPHWRLDALTAFIGWGLESLRHRIETAPDQRRAWEQAFHTWHYPVGWNWELRGEGDCRPSQRHIGGFTAENTATDDLAFATINGLIARHGCITLLGELTNGAWFEHRDNFALPVLLPEHDAQLAALPDEAARRAAFENLVRPFAIGAVAIELTDAEAQDGEDVPPHVARQLQDIDRRLDIHRLAFTGEINGRKADLRLIVQIEPLVADYDRQQAYHEMTVGLFIPPEISGNEAVQRSPTDWSPAERETLWTELFQQLDRLPELLRLKLEGTAWSSRAGHGKPSAQ